jgi:spermidine synthase
MPGLVQPTVTLQRVRTPRGELVLRRAGADLELLSNGVFLMDTRGGRSERLLVRAALDAHASPRHVLVGGLGMGFSLQEAVADPRVRRVTVLEIEPVLVGWHTTYLSAHSRDALADPRVAVVVDDVHRHLAGTGDRYDVICLDVDNGPDWTVTPANARLYGDAGTDLLVARLRPGGVLAVWSAGAAPAYEQRLQERLTQVRALAVPVARGEPDLVYLGRRP